VSVCQCVSVSVCLCVAFVSCSEAVSSVVSAWVSRCLVCLPRGSQFIPASNMDTYLRPAMPKAQFHVVDDADHMVYMNRCVVALVVVFAVVVSLLLLLLLVVAVVCCVWCTSVHARAFCRARLRRAAVFLRGWCCVQPRRVPATPAELSAASLSFSSVTVNVTHQSSSTVSALGWYTSATTTRGVVCRGAAARCRRSNERRTGAHLHRGDGGVCCVRQSLHDSRHRDRSPFP
jgi:hypothetical protein